MGISALMRTKAIFLDRDGVLNESIVKNGKPYPPKTVAELIVADDVLPALQLLKSLGYLLIGATNQPDVARGTTTRETIEAINATLMTLLPLDDMRVCYHDDKDGCLCRKPLPGLILSAAQEWNIHLTESIMIGDRWKDIEAGQQAGCKTIWLDKNYQETKPKKQPDFTALSLMQAAQWIKENS